jgi:hypothetical protein
MPPLKTRCPLIALAVAAWLTVAPTAAFAGHHGGDPDDYHAAFVRKSDDRTLESGQEATSWVEARNISDTVTWDNTVVKLGADEPHDRTSPMYWDQDWLSPSRPTFMDQRTVGPNQVGRFTFRVKAPAVNVSTHYREFLAPVAEGVAWMDGAEWGTDGRRAIDYVITPPNPPSVSLTNVPVRIRRGDPLRVEARARDDYEMRGVRMSVGAAAIDATAPDPNAPDTYVGELPTGDLPPGFHTLSVTGTDHVGNDTTVTHQFEVFEPPPPPPPPQLDSSVSLRGRVLRRGRGIRALSLRVKAPIGSRISVSCRPKPRCRNLVVGATKATTTRLRGLRGRRLRRGTQIYVKVTRLGMIGELTLLTVGRRNVVSNQYPLREG